MISPIKLVLGLGLAAVTLAAPTASADRESSFDTIVSIISDSRKVLKQTAAFIKNFPADGTASPSQFSDILNSINTAINKEVTDPLIIFTGDNGFFDSAELKSITQEVDVLIPGIEKVLSGLSAKKPAFEASNPKKEVNDKVSSYLGSFDKHTADYLTAVANGAAPESRQHFNDLKSQIKTEFASTRSLFFV